MLTRTLAAAAILATLAFPASAMADENGTVGGAVAGAIGGAVVGGPVGLVVGGVGGAVAGKAGDQSSAVLSPLRRETPSVLPHQRPIGPAVRARDPSLGLRPSTGRRRLSGFLLLGFTFPFRRMPQWARGSGKSWPRPPALPIVPGILLKGADFERGRARPLADRALYACRCGNSGVVPPRDPRLIRRQMTA